MEHRQLDRARTHLLIHERGCVPSCTAMPEDEAKGLHQVELPADMSCLARLGVRVGGTYLTTPSGVRFHYGLSARIEWCDCTDPYCCSDPDHLQAEDVMEALELPSALFRLSLHVMRGSCCIQAVLHLPWRYGSPASLIPQLDRAWPTPAGWSYIDGNFESPIDLDAVQIAANQIATRDTLKVFYVAVAS